MRILISGGLGFMGSALAVKLLSAGHEVRMLDTRDCDELGPAEYHRGSVLASADCAAACDGIDVVVHSAAIHDTAAVDANPLAAIEINVKGTTNLFSSAVAAGAGRFIYMSSAKVYGDPGDLPSTETDVLEPRETYALSKVSGEHHLHLMQADSGIEVAILRPFSVYGPAQDLGSGYVGMLLASVLGERDVRLPGHPGFRRDFVHIDDATQLCADVTTADSLPGLRILNVGSGQSNTLRRLLEHASDIMGFDVPIGYRAPGPGTLTRTHACLKRSAAQFGYRPTYDLHEGLAHTIKWFMSSEAKASNRAYE
jgi:UDP-N-acetylglucosamine 4-epimerase